MSKRPPVMNPGRLSDLARHVVMPSGVTATAWPPVRDLLASLGVTFDQWQDGLGRLALAKRADGKWASTVGGVTLSIPRQVAKTFIVSRIVVALCILTPGMTVLWTAHRTRTATNTFRGLATWCQSKKLRPHVAAIRATNGEQEIRFRNGSVIMFGAREQGFGRGFDAVDVEVFDEAQILTEKALDDMVPAANQATHPAGGLLFFMGTPPRPGIDPGEAFTRKRTRALSGEDFGGCYVEFSADPDADSDDRKQWAKANPSFPSRVPLESMLRMRENLASDDSWRREALGIWDAVVSGIVDPTEWAACEDRASTPTSRLALGIEVGPGLAWASVSLAGQRADGRWHVELVEDQHSQGRGVAWLAPLVEGILERNPEVSCVVGDVGGPLAALVEEKHGRWSIRGSRVVVTPMKVAELSSACELTLDGITSGSLVHIGQPQLTAAAVVVTRRQLADTGRWVWHRRAAESDITPMQSATYALRGAQFGGRRPLKAPAGAGREVVSR